jgi:hypothetical protein
MVGMPMIAVTRESGDMRFDRARGFGGFYPTLGFTHP